MLCRRGSACVGSALGLAAFPNHDFFSVLAGTPATIMHCHEKVLRYMLFNTNPR